MSWSDFQLAIFAAVEVILKTGRDLVVLARAGTGKSTTMVEAVIRFCAANPRAQVLTCAFNKKNADELREKLEDAGLHWKQAQAKTLNGVGLSACKRWNKKIIVDPSKGRKIAKVLADRYNNHADAEERISGLRGKVAKLATLAKITLTARDDDDAMRDLFFQYGVGEWAEAKVTVRLAKQAMVMAKDDENSVDFDDQLWFPWVFNMTPWQFDLVIVDEAQDMNASQLWLARQSVKRNGRLVAVGDDRQAIYQWRGADSGFLGRMVDELGADTLTLPRTYRCGQLIVEEAKQLVPDYEAAEGNPEGIVRETDLDELHAKAAPGDFILSRINAPLLGLCLGFLKRSIPAVVQGRDIMGQLISTIERSQCSTTAELSEWINAYEMEEAAKLKQQDAEEAIIEALHDRCACLAALAPERVTCEDLIDFIGNDLFSDVDSKNVITLSSVHRAKGMERDRVWMLNSTFKEGSIEDQNIRYVAVTRAKDELIYVQ